MKMHNVLAIVAFSASAFAQVGVTITDVGGNKAAVVGTAVKVDGSAVTQPVSAASLPLPTGAATAAKQPALGAAGSASADVLSVQGVASMTPLKVDGSGVTQPVSGTVTTTPPSNASTNLAQVAGTAADTNSGNKSAGTLRVVLATDQPALTNALKVDGSSVTQPVSGTVTTSPPANASTNQTQIAGSTLVADACQVNAKTYGTFSGTTNTKIISGVSSKKIYFCSWNDQVGGTATNYAIVEGTGTTCATMTVAFPGLSGGSTAAGGWNVAANGGRVIGNGSSAFAGESVAADDVCVFTSAATQLNIGFSYVSQ